MLTYPVGLTPLDFEQVVDGHSTQANPAHSPSATAPRSSPSRHSPGSNHTASTRDEYSRCQRILEALHAIHDTWDMHSKDSGGNNTRWSSTAMQQSVVLLTARLSDEVPHLDAVRNTSRLFNVFASQILSPSRPAAPKESVFVCFVCCGCAHVG